MQISMTSLEQLSLSEMEALLAGSGKINWEATGIAEKYSFVGAVLKAQCYRKLGRGERGVVRQFLATVTSTSRAQVTRLIGQWMKERKITRKPVKRPGFTVRYRREDMVLLAATDAAHEDLSGPAPCRILWREFEVFGTARSIKASGSESNLHRAARSPSPSSASPIRAVGRDT